MNTAIIEDESGKDAVLFHTNYSRLRHPFPIVYIVAYNTTYVVVLLLFLTFSVFVANPKNYFTRWPILLVVR